MWDRMLPALLDRFRIVRVDLLGFGESGGELDERIAVGAAGRLTDCRTSRRKRCRVGHTPPWEQPEETATLIAQFASANDCP
jgi:pimeloyl-ACP methyl ester carboxylesterase